MYMYMSAFVNGRQCHNAIIQATCISERSGSLPFMGEVPARHADSPKGSSLTSLQ